MARLLKKAPPTKGRGNGKEIIGAFILRIHLKPLLGRQYLFHEQSSRCLYTFTEAEGQPMADALQNCINIEAVPLSLFSISAIVISFVILLHGKPASFYLQYIIQL